MGVFDTQGREPTANRKRPNSFQSLVGQEFVVETLTHAIDSGAVANAYLFFGPRGVGKTSAARILARALNCPDGPTAAPCTEYQLHDVIEIDGASNPSVNDVREIREEVLFAPTASRYKIYIIDEVHMLSGSAFNALLKTIEEPPPYIVFIFATTEIHRVPATIRSRCQQFAFRLLPIDTIRGCLASTCEEKQIDADADSLLWIAREARGSLRDAYTLLDQVISFTEGKPTIERIAKTMGIVDIGALNRLGELLVNGDVGEALQMIDTMLSSGISVERLIIDIGEYYRNVLFINHGIVSQNILGYAKTRFSSTVIEAYTSEQIEEALERLLGMYRQLRYALNQRFELELVISRIALLPKRISPTMLFDRLTALRGELLGGEYPTSDEPQRAPATPAGETTTAIATANQNPAVKRPATDSQEMQRQVIHALESKHPTLALSLKKAHGWEITHDTLVLQIDNHYEHEMATRESETLQEVLHDLFARTITVQIGKQRPRSAQDDPDDPYVKRVQDIFQGDVVKRK